MPGCPWRLLIVASRSARMTAAENRKLAALLGEYIKDNDRFLELLSAQARMGEQITSIQKAIQRIEENHVTSDAAAAMRSRITRLESIVGGFVLLIVVAVVTVWIRSAVPTSLAPPGVVTP